MKSNKITQAYKVGDAVIYSGFEGAVREVCAGQLSGLYVIQLDRGQACVDGSELKPVKASSN